MTDETAPTEHPPTIDSDGAWIGVDLDGTLAEYHGWPSDGSVGPPIPKMLERVKRWLAAGRRVKIFTARVGPGQGRDLCEHLSRINIWCDHHLGQVLEITATKDSKMVELWDDRCVQVLTNTGETLAEQQIRTRTAPAADPPTAASPEATAAASAAR